MGSLALQQKPPAPTIGKVRPVRETKVRSTRLSARILVPSSTNNNNNNNNNAVVRSAKTGVVANNSSSTLSTSAKRQRTTNTAGIKAAPSLRSSLEKEKEKEPRPNSGNTLSKDLPAPLPPPPLQLSKQGNNHNNIINMSNDNLMNNINTNNKMRGGDPSESSVDAMETAEFLTRLALEDCVVCLESLQNMIVYFLQPNANDEKRFSNKRPGERAGVDPFKLSKRPLVNIAEDLSSQLHKLTERFETLFKRGNSIDKISENVKEEKETVGGTGNQLHEDTFGRLEETQYTFFATNKDIINENKTTVEVQPFSTNTFGKMVSTYDTHSPPILSTQYSEEEEEDNSYGERNIEEEEELAHVKHNSIMLDKSTNTLCLDVLHQSTQTDIMNRN